MSAKSIALRLRKVEAYRLIDVLIMAGLTALVALQALSMVRGGLVA